MTENTARYSWGFFFGTLVSLICCMATANTILKPGVESYEEFNQLADRHLLLIGENELLKFQLETSKLDLDTLRRSVREPFNPKGKDIAPEDRIPVPAVPLPTMPVPAPVPVAPNEKDDVLNDQPQQEEGEELGMAEAKKPTTAIAKSLGASLAIQSVSELMMLADVLFKGGANQIQGLGRPEAVAHVILAGAEVGFSPTQSLGCIMLLDGKTTIYGDGGLALVRASGLLDGEVNEVVEGEGDDRRAVCKLKRKGESEKTFTFSMAEAKRAGLIDRAKGKGPWATYPDRMLKMRARGFALRDLFSDVLRGLAIYEEVQDASVVNTEVKVLGTTSDKPHAQPQQQPTTPAVESDQQTATFTAPTASAALPAPQLDGPITGDQLDEFAKLKPLVMASKGIGGDPLKVRAEWEQILAKYNTTTAKTLTTAQAAELITDLRAKHDPFSNPDSARGASA